jgi:hypothetical protein
MKKVITDMITATINAAISERGREAKIWHPFRKLGCAIQLVVMPRDIEATSWQPSYSLEDRNHSVNMSGSTSLSLILKLRRIPYGSLECVLTTILI